MSAIVRNARRRRGPQADPGIEGTYGGSYYVNLNEIAVEVDFYGDGRRVETVIITEAAYPGVIAEWTAGTATTVLEAAIEAEIVAAPNTEPLTATQKANLIGKAVAYPV